MRQLLIELFDGFLEIWVFRDLELKTQLILKIHSKSVKVCLAALLG